MRPHRDFAGFSRGLMLSVTSSSRPGFEASTDIRSMLVMGRRLDR
ncbi:hypothetical protein [Deinococcus frigens]|nr:hypothetical protein [Deinococcus frigens]